MRILLLTHSFNSLAQRCFVELSERGHDVTIEFDVHDQATLEAVELAQPELIVAPFLKRAIPEPVWRQYVCLVIHPGPAGDRGPTALDWAILEEAREWGVTVLQAEAEMDAGPVWASAAFPMRPATKSSLYRLEVVEAAIKALLEAVDRFPQGPTHRPARSYWRPAVTQRQRAIDWARDDTATVLRKIRSGDGYPGLLDALSGEPVYLFDAHAAPGFAGQPGSAVARCGHAICRATMDGAVWIGHARRTAFEPPIKLPATQVLAPLLDRVPEVGGFEEIRYAEKDGVGYLDFPFYNGAMSTRQCEQLRAAYGTATRRATRVIVLRGGSDFWSNGIHLNVIESASSPADESWANINAMDDLCRDIISTPSHLTIAALQGNAGAGGVFLALAADWVVARHGVVLNPHYKGMGNLYGSEYWTYLLPRRAGEDRAREVTLARLPMGVMQAKRMGLIDDHFGDSAADFHSRLDALAHDLAQSPGLELRLAQKRDCRKADEAVKPLDSYRAEELEKLKLNFYGFDPSYHVARYNFVYKVPKSRTPYYLARHRT
jgi:putative two-component system protein, hydrogenase maturation factor HypX/HoxX